MGCGTSSSVAVSTQYRAQRSNTRSRDIVLASSSAPQSNATAAAIPSTEGNTSPDQNLQRAVATSLPIHADATTTDLHLTLRDQPSVGLLPSGTSSIRAWLCGAASATSLCRLILTFLSPNDRYWHSRTCKKHFAELDVPVCIALAGDNKDALANELEEAAGFVLPWPYGNDSSLSTGEELVKCSQLLLVQNASLEELRAWLRVEQNRRRTVTLMLDRGWTSEAVFARNQLLRQECSSVRNVFCRGDNDSLLATWPFDGAPDGKVSGPLGVLQRFGKAIEHWYRPDCWPEEFIREILKDEHALECITFVETLRLDWIDALAKMPRLCGVSLKQSNSWKLPISALVSKPWTRSVRKFHVRGLDAPTHSPTPQLDFGLVESLYLGWVSDIGLRTLGVDCARLRFLSMHCFKSPTSDIFSCWARAPDGSLDVNKTQSLFPVLEELYLSASVSADNKFIITAERFPALRTLSMDWAQNAMIDFRGFDSHRACPLQTFNVRTEEAITVHFAADMPALRSLEINAEHLPEVKTLFVDASAETAAGASASTLFSSLQRTLTGLTVHIGERDECVPKNFRLGVALLSLKELTLKVWDVHRSVVLEADKLPCLQSLAVLPARQGKIVVELRGDFAALEDVDMGRNAVRGVRVRHGNAPVLDKFEAMSSIAVGSVQVTCSGEPSMTLLRAKPRPHGPGKCRCCSEEPDEDAEDAADDEGDDGGDEEGEETDEEGDDTEEPAALQSDQLPPPAEREVEAQQEPQS